MCDHDQQFDDLKEQLDCIERENKDHVTEYHAFKVAELRVMVAQHEELTRSVPINTKLLEGIVDVLEGPEEFNLLNEPKGRTGGMVGRQAMIERDLASIKHDANGGRGFSVRNRDKITIGAIAVMPTIAIFIVSIVWGI